MRNLTIVPCFLAVASLTIVLGGCDLIGNSDEPEVIAIVDYDGIHTDAINKKRELCINPDSVTTDLKTLKPKIVSLYLDKNAHDSLLGRPVNAAPEEFTGPLFNTSLEAANTYMYSDMLSSEAGYYDKTGGRAYFTNYYVCFVSKTSSDMARYQFSFAPPRAISGGGGYNTKREAQSFINQWIEWKFANEREPKTYERMSASEWHPCGVKESVYKSSCYARLRTRYLREPASLTVPSKSQP